MVQKSKVPLDDCDPIQTFNWKGWVMPADLSVFNGGWRSGLQIEHQRRLQSIIHMQHLVACPEIAL
jgi:hypothetical protein